MKEDKIINQSRILIQQFRYAEAYNLIKPIINSNLGNNEGIIKFLLAAICLIEMSEFKNAEDLLQLGVNKIEKSNNQYTPEEKISFYHELALLSLQLNKLDKSLLYSTKSLLVAMEQPYKGVISGFAIYQEFDLENFVPHLHILSIIFQKQLKFQESLTALLILKNYSERQYDLNMLSITYHELGNVFFSLNKNCESVTFYRKSLEIKKQIEKPSNQTMESISRVILNCKNKKEQLILMELLK